MVSLMDKNLDEWLNIRMDGWIEIWIDGSMEKYYWLARWLEGWINGWMDHWKDGKWVENSCLEKKNKFLNLHKLINEKIDFCLPR